MENRGTLILNHREIEQKIRRIAYQLYEHNSNETELILAGIMSAGFELATKLEGVLSDISPLDIKLCKLDIDKANPLAGAKSSLSKKDYENKVVVLTDDVLNSGSTLIYGAKHFLEVPLKKLQTVVLVDRSHKKFPIKADFKGISLSTSLNEMVEVSFGNEDKAELF